MYWFSDSSIDFTFLFPLRTVIYVVKKKIDRTRALFTSKYFQVFPLKKFIWFCHFESYKPILVIEFDRTMLLCQPLKQWFDIKSE